MRVRNLLLVAVAALAVAMPARADLLLSFRTPNSPPTFPNSIPAAYSEANTTAIPLPNTVGLVMLPGETRYVNVALLSNATNPGPGQTFWNNQATMPQLATFGINMTFNGATADNPYIPLGTPPTLAENNANLRIQAGYGNALPGDPYPANFRQFVGLATGGLGLDGSFGLLDAASNPVNLVVVGTFRIVAGAPGSTDFVLSRLTTGGPGGPAQNNWQVTDNVTSMFLDTEVFSAAHPNFSLHVTVVPEPTSMCLAGVAFAGLGWRFRKLRNKTATATV
jgi:hypothetical protein